MSVLPNKEADSVCPEPARNARTRRSRSRRSISGRNGIESAADLRCVRGLSPLRTLPGHRGGSAGHSRGTADRLTAAPQRG